MTSPEAPILRACEQTPGARRRAGLDGAHAHVVCHLARMGAVAVGVCSGKPPEVDDPAALAVFELVFDEEGGGARATRSRASFGPDLREEFARI
jgi:hypothetical protein